MTKFVLSNVKELNQRLTEVWSRQQHNILNTAVRDCRKHLRACICTRGKILNIYFRNSIFYGLNVLI